MEHHQERHPPGTPAPLELELPEAARDEAHGELRSGDLCPQCGRVRLEYDGLLNLSCVLCGYTVGGCFT